MGDSIPDASADGATLGADRPRDGLGRRELVRAGLGGAVAAGAVAAGAGSAVAQAYDGWFDGVDNYEGTVDYRGREEVTVEVGAGENGLRFEPPAILVDPGATVVWEWTGEGGQHNVVHEPEDEEDPAFESELLGEAGETFSQTFEDEAEAVYRYYCDPHRGAGMRGAVAVGDVDDELIDPEGSGGGGGPLGATDALVLALGLGMVGLLLLLVLWPAYTRETTPQ